MANKNSIHSFDVSTKYNTVEVSKNLPKVNQDYPCNKHEHLPPVDYWMNQIKLQGLKKYKGVQHIMANGPRKSLKKLCFILHYVYLFSDTSLCKKHAILSAFLYAYNSHEDIVLSPDDIWMMICMYFSKYVNDNAEKLRSLFVDHEDQKKLTVVQEVPPDQTEPK
jgi:hypothetical protein